MSEYSYTKSSGSRSSDAHSPLKVAVGASDAAAAAHRDLQRSLQASTYPLLNMKRPKNGPFLRSAASGPATVSPSQPLFIALKSAKTPLAPPVHPKTTPPTAAPFERPNKRKILDSSFTPARALPQNNLEAPVAAGTKAKEPIMEGLEPLGNYTPALNQAPSSLKDIVDVEMKENMQKGQQPGAAIPPWQQSLPLQPLSRPPLPKPTTKLHLADLPLRSPPSSPSPMLLTACTDLHKHAPTEALRISATAHFISLCLVAFIGDKQSITMADLYGWGKVYGFTAEDVSAAAQWLNIG